MFTLALAVLSSQLLQAACPGLTLPASWGLPCGVTLPAPMASCLFLDAALAQVWKDGLRRVAAPHDFFTPQGRESPGRPGPVVPAGESGGRWRQRFRAHTGPAEVGTLL